MKIGLFQVYGIRRASNPHARNWAPHPLASPRFGPRRYRRAMRSVLRKSGALDA